MASRHEIVTIDFRANAAKANPAMESLRSSAYDLRQEIEKTKTAIDEGIKTGKPQAELDKMGEKLANQERQLRSFNQAMTTLSKGVGTLARAIDAFNTGTLDNMSAAFQKSAYNAAEVAKKALRPDSKTYQKDMAELDALQQKNLENLAKYKLRTEQLLNSIETGGKISSQDLKQEGDALRELMQILPHMGREWLEYNQLLTRVTDATKQQAEAEKRLTGAIVDANDARQRASQLNREGAEAAARQHKEAEAEVAMRKQNIEALEKEAEAKQKEVSVTAALAIAKDKEVEKTKKSIAAIQERIDNEDRDAKKTKKKVETLNEEADKLEKNAKTSRETAESMKTDLKGVHDELKQVNAELEKMGVNTKASQEATAQESKQNAEDQKREDLLKRKEKLETQQGELIDKIATKEEEAAGMVQKAANKRDEATQAIEKQKGAHEENAKAMGIETDNLKKQTEEQDFLHGKLGEQRKDLAGIKQQIDENANAQQQAQQKAAQTEKLTIDAMTEAVKVLEEKNRAIESESAEWQENTRLIQQYKAEIDRLKQQPVIQMMTERLGNVKNLSKEALSETLKFWQAMEAGAERGSHKLQVAAGNVKMLMEEERQRRMEIQKPMRENLNNLNRLSTNDLAETKKYWEAVRDGAEAGSAAYKKAELAVKALNNEENRRKSNAQAQYIHDQMQDLNNLSVSGLAEVKKYWQAMYDGAKKGSDEMKDAEAALKRINELEAQNSRNNLKRQAHGLFGDLSGKSFDEINASIAAGKKLLATYKAGGPAAEKLSKAILDAEEYVKQYGVEAERSARKEQELNQKMTERMSNLKKLSDEGLVETKKYWEAQRAGAERGSQAFMEAEAHIKAITEQQKVYATIQQRQSARQILRSDLTTMSEEDLRRAIAAAKEYMQQFSVGGKVREKYNEAILRGEELLKEYSAETMKAKQKEEELRQTMVGRMSNLSQLSNEGLEQTKRYWEAQMAGAERASEAYKEAERNIKAINEEQKQLAHSQLQKNASGVFGVFSNKSEGELRSSVVAAKEYLLTLTAGGKAYNKLSNAILEAEKYLNQYGLEAERAKQKEQELADTMTQRMSNLSQLSAGALEETKKYWQAQLEGARRGSQEALEYEQRIKAIDKEQKHFNNEQMRGAARSILTNRENMSEEELRRGIAAAREYMQQFKIGGEVRERYNRAIMEGEDLLKQYSIEAERAKQKEQEMIANMERLPKLTATALEETKRFWETQLAGAERGSAAAKQFEDNIKAINAEQKQLQHDQLKKDATGVFGIYSSKTEEELRSAITAAREYVLTLTAGGKAHEKMSKAIVAAENYLAQYGLEVERTKQRQTESNELMVNQLKLGRSLTETALKAQEKYWQELIDNPKTAANEMAYYIEQLNKVKELQKEQADAQVKTGGLTVLSNMRSDLNYEDKISENQRKEDIAALQAYSDSLPKEGNASVLKEIDYYLKQLGATAKETAQDVMSVNDALMLAAKAGTSAFAATPQEIQAATKAIEKQRDAIIQTIKVKRESGQATDKEEKELQDLTNKLRGLKFELDNVNMSQAKMQALMEEPANAVNLDELRAAIKRADGQLRIMKDSLGEGSKEYQNFAEKVKNAKNELKEMEGQAQANTSAWEKAWSRLKTYVGMYMGFNMAWQHVTGTADDLMELSDKMGEVRKTTDLSAEAVGRLTNNLKKMDVRTGLVQLEELAASAGQLGLKREEDILGFTQAANKLMIALPEMGKEAATQMMRVAMATGEVKKIEEQMQQGIIDGSSATAVAMEKIASTIDRLRASSASTAPEITDFVKRVGAVGAQSGITIDQIAAMGSTISSLGMRIEMSATALSRMIPAIKNNAFAIGKIIGKTETEIKEKFENGMGMEVILDVFKAIRGNVSVTADDIINNTENMEKAAEKVEEMFGGSMKEVMAELNQQGARAGIVFAGLSQNVDQLEKQLGIASKAYEENIAIQKEFDKMNDTTAAKWERFKNQIEEWIIGDWQQRWLGALIDGLRELADWLSEDGPLAIAFKSWVAYLAALKMGFGSFFTGIGQGFSVLRTAMLSGVNVLATAAGNAIYALTGMTNAMRGLRAATIGARREWVKMDKAMKSNLIGAIIAALGMLAYKLWDIHKAAKEAAADTARFNQQVADEQHALDKLMDPLEKSNTAQEERSKLIKDINAQYGKYLGYMLSEYSSAMQVADAHALIAKRIKQEAYERRLAEQERKVYEEHDETINEAYGGVEKAVRGSAKSGTDVNAVADMLKSYIDQNLDRTETLESFRAFRTELNNMLERLVTDGKLTRGSISSVTPRLLDYMDAAKQRANDLKAATSGIRSDLRTINSSIQNDLTRNLNNLVGNIANFAKQQTQTPAPAPAPMPALAPGQSTALTPFWQQGGGSGKGFGLFDMNGRSQQEQTVQRAPIGWKPQLNEKDVEEVRQFVENQKNLRSMLQNDAANMEKSTREIYESWQVSDEEMTRLEKIVTKADKKTPGGDNTKPYGSYDVMDGYEKWDADALVKRKKQMLDYVRAMANGADVQAILAQDKKFMDEATRKGIKDVRDAIEWYNTERLKIQEELADRHLTNEGNWANPSKAKGRRKRMPIAESAIAELERYYQWRKETIEEKRAEEGMSEAEYNRRLETLEMEHLQKRSDLRKSYITKDKQFVTQFRDWWKSVRELDAVEWELIEIEVKAATERERKYIGMNAQKDLTSMQAIVVKQLNAIEEIIAKERPFNGITKNLEENLTKMGILFADFDKKRNELVAKGASKEELDKVDAAADAERNKRLLWLLQQAEDGYTLTIDEMMRRMADSGFQAWVDELSSNENGDEMKRALLAQLHTSYDAVQEAIKKEASIIKKQVEVMWSDVAKGQSMSIKDQYEEIISKLGVQQDSVSRANQLIGAGAASERVADKLAIKQLQLRITMQEHYYNLMRKQGAERIAFLRDEAKLEKEKAARLKKQIEQETDEEKKRELAMKMEKAERNAMQASLDAEHVDTSLNLAKTKEKAELLKLQTELTAKAEESQNRMYTQLREWADLFASSIQSMMEASHAGDAEYYNERAKMELTGKGGPGAGTYIVIDNEGTSDARAHYEYLDQRQALERQRDIERQNAQAEAFKKMWDDINNKMNEQITDWINASMQNASVDANTSELNNLETKIDEGKMKVDGNISVIKEDISATKSNTDAVIGLTEKIGDIMSGKTGETPTDSRADLANALAATETPDGGTLAGDAMNLLGNMLGVISPGESRADYANSMIPQEAPAGGEAPQYTPSYSQDAERWASNMAGVESFEELINASDKNAKKQKKNNKDVQESTQSMFAKMTAAANMYGVAYQAMSNDNLSAAQKFEMIALQAAGQTAITMLTTNLAQEQGKQATQMPGILGKLLGDMPYPAAMAAYALITALMGGLMGLAVSKVAKSKSQIAQVTGASSSAGRLATGMLTYASGNVNELSDPSSLTPGRHYNVDGADGKTYRAKYMGKNAKTHITNGPEFHLVGEKGQEAIIDAHTTQLIRMNDTGIWRDIQTLYNGGSLSTVTRHRRGKGIRTFADGNIDEFDAADGASIVADAGFSPEMAAQFQASIDRNNDLLERALSEGIKGVFNVYGKGGLVDSYDTGKKTVNRHGERF